MDEILRALGGLLLQAIPTFLLVLALYFYLKRVYFGPLARVLAERHQATEGARKLAQETFDRASAKAAEYEAALRNARSEIYREKEEFRQKLLQDQAGAAQQARQNAGALVEQASRQLGEELARARESLALQTDSLAEQIARGILDRRTG
jgi:F-type H+-transporting ATPase subunit b